MADDATRTLPVSGCLLRLFWMAGGNLALVILTMAILDQPVWTLTLVDALFWALATGGAALLADEIELAQLIVTTLNLDVSPEDIDPAAPLYGEGLGLDSIDILEISLAISKKYGVKLRSDSADSRQTFRSLRSLSRYIAERRKQ